MTSFVQAFVDDVARENAAHQCHHYIAAKNWIGKGESVPQEGKTKRGAMTGRAGCIRDIRFAGVIDTEGLRLRAFG
jgi:hypothetical protein